MKNITKTIATVLFTSTLIAPHVKAQTHSHTYFFEEHPCLALVGASASVVGAQHPEIIAFLGPGRTTFTFWIAVAGMPVFSYMCLASAVRLSIEEAESP